MAQATKLTTEVNGLEISIDYNVANMRLTQVSWIILAGYLARVRIWNGSNLVVDRSILGASTDSQNIPGNITMVEEIIDGIIYIVLPPEINYILNLESIG